MERFLLYLWQKIYEEREKMIIPFKSKELVTGALAGRNLRNQMINSNLANVDTPFYKARDIEFETALAIPKSVTLAIPSSVIIILENDIST